MAPNFVNRAKVREKIMSKGWEDKNQGALLLGNISSHLRAPANPVGRTDQCRSSSIEHYT